MPKIVWKEQAAFTLLELLIVILLISIFYYLVSGSFKRDNTENKQTLTIENIRDYPLSYLPPEGAELVCLDDCKNCFIHDYGTGKTKDVKSSLPKLKAYILDRSGEAVQVNFGRIHDKPVCIRYRYYNNGSVSEMIISAKDDYYYIPPYFGKIEKYSSLSDAVERYKWTEGKFMDKSDYY